MKVPGFKATRTLVIGCGMLLTLSGFSWRTEARGEIQPNSWKSIPLPRVEDRMQAIHIALLPNGRVLIVNGTSNRSTLDAKDQIVYGSNVLEYDVFDNASLFDPKTDTYTRLHVPPAPRVPSIDGEVRRLVADAGKLKRTDTPEDTNKSLADALETIASLFYLQRKI